MRVLNRRARHDYQLLEKYEAGIVLTGGEVKSAKEGRIKLDESFVKLFKDGAWLINAHVAPYQYADSRDYQPDRPRKLLLHQREIFSLAQKMQRSNLTIVPTACYSKKGKIKIEIALARGKKKWDKREAIKRRDLEREARKELKINN